MTAVKTSTERMRLVKAFGGRCRCYPGVIRRNPDVCSALKTARKAFFAFKFGW